MILNTKNEAKWDGFWLILGILAVWMVIYWLVGNSGLSSPISTVSYIYEELQNSNFRSHLYATLTAFSWAVIISVFAGVCLGVVMGIVKLAGEVAEPLLNGMYSVPKVTLYPIVLLAFGLGMTAKVAFGIIHGIIPIILFTMNALRHVDKVHWKTSRALKLTRLQTLWYVLIPVTVPEVVSGIRIGMSLTLLGTIVGEMFASQKGLGFLIISAIELNNVRLITSVVLILFIFAIILNGLMLKVEKLLKGN